MPAPLQGAGRSQLLAGWAAPASRLGAASAAAAERPLATRSASCRRPVPAPAELRSAHRRGAADRVPSPSPQEFCPGLASRLSVFTIPNPESQPVFVLLLFLGPCSVKDFIFIK